MPKHLPIFKTQPYPVKLLILEEKLHINSIVDFRTRFSLVFYLSLSLKYILSQFAKILRLDYNLVAKICRGIPVLTDLVLNFEFLVCFYFYRCMLSALFLYIEFNNLVWLNHFWPHRNLEKNFTVFLILG